MFENRLVFVDKLVSMGARIIPCDPHRVVVIGPARLIGQRMSSPDIRAGMALLIASLCAEGTSTIGNVSEIDRGYERIDERLRSLGAVDRARLLDRAIRDGCRVRSAAWCGRGWECGSSSPRKAPRASRRACRRSTTSSASWRAAAA